VLSSATYWGQFEEIGKYNANLNVAERLWAAWYAWMQNDVLATGIMSFMMHELVYFGRSLPWIFIDSLGLFKGYKIQSVSEKSAFQHPVRLSAIPGTPLANPWIEQDPLLARTVGLR
jgi:hypothetical protein